MRRTIEFHFRGGFTLIELLVVVAIMGMMGTLSVASYRAMRLGMERKAVVQSVSQFMNLAYQRAQLDNVPVHVYYWNETRQIETDDTELVAMGRAVAVRRVGRITHMRGNERIYDEFGDFDSMRYMDEDGEYDDDAADNDMNAKGMPLYRINGNESKAMRCLIRPSAISYTPMAPGLASYPKEHTDNSNPGRDVWGDKIRMFGMYVSQAKGFKWNVGDAYGFEFAELELPQGYLFTGARFDSKRETDEIDAEVLRYDSHGNDDRSKSLGISALLPNQVGELDKVSVGKADAPE